MSSQRSKDEIKRDLLALFEEMYSAAHRDGEASVAGQLVQLANNLSQMKPTVPTGVVQWDALVTPVDRQKRAPKGAGDKAIRAVLKGAGQSLYLEEIQAGVAALDSRVASKSIYNLLRTNKAKTYEQVGDKWRLVESKTETPTTW